MKLIDRYLTVELCKRLLVVLVIVLGSLVLERLLRLFDFVSIKGGPFYMVWEMALMLVPHYMGLALPAGFFVAVFLVVSNFCSHNEFDVLLSGGTSPMRFSIPFIVSGFVLLFVSLGVFGYLQPYGRYSYRAVRYLVQTVPWSEQIPEKIFATVAKGATVSADHVSANGQDLHGVFVHLMADGDDVAVTAQRGKLEFGPRKVYYQLQLWNGVQLVTKPNGQVISTRFHTMRVKRNFMTNIAPFRNRGDDVRELSIPELYAQKRISRDGDWSPAEANAELHARLVRSFSLIILPFLAIPLAQTAKRRKRSAGLVTGAVMLVTFHYILQTLQGMAAVGKVSVAGMWITLLIFGILSLILFWRTQKHPGQNPLDTLFDHIANGFGKLAGMFARKRRVKS